MDDYVKALLREWQLEELIPRFEDEEVNEKAFKCLTDDIIRELIPKLGKRAIFNSAYRAYREILDRNSSSTTCATSTASVKLESVISTPPDDGPSEHNIPFQVDMLPLEQVKLESIVPPPDDTKYDVKAPETNLEPPSEDEIDVDPEPSRISFSIGALENPSEEDRCTADLLRRFLITSKSAKHLLGKTFLTRSSRNLLVVEVVDYLCATNGGVPSNRELHCWSRAIDLVFNDEISALYFRETEDGSSCGGKFVEELKKRRDEAESV